jgi:hypothetical protein
LKQRQKENKERRLANERKGEIVQVVRKNSLISKLKSICFFASILD